MYLSYINCSSATQDHDVKNECDSSTLFTGSNCDDLKIADMSTQDASVIKKALIHDNDEVIHFELPIAVDSVCVLDNKNEMSDVYYDIKENHTQVVEDDVTFESIAVEDKIGDLMSESFFIAERVDNNKIESSIPEVVMNDKVELVIPEVVIDNKIESVINDEAKHVDIAPEVVLNKIELAIPEVVINDKVELVIPEVAIDNKIESVIKDEAKHVDIVSEVVSNKIESSIPEVAINDKVELVIPEVVENHNIESVANAIVNNIMIESVGDEVVKGDVKQVTEILIDSHLSSHLSEGSVKFVPKDNIKDNRSDHELLMKRRYKKRELLNENEIELMNIDNLAEARSLGSDLTFGDDNRKEYFIYFVGIFLLFLLFFIIVVLV